jgi:hypothetical protein
MQSKARTVREYLAELPEDRRKAIEAVRKVVRANLDPRIQEGVQYGMIGWSVPHSVHPEGYHCDPSQPLPFACLASQKGYMSLYLFCLYTEPEEIRRFEAAWKASGKKLDMGKSCVRFRKLEDVPLEVIGEAVRRMGVDRFLESYRRGLGASPAGQAARKKSARKAVARKPAAARKKATSSAARKPVRKTLARRGGS